MCHAHNESKNDSEERFKQHGINTLVTTRPIPYLHQTYIRWLPSPEVCRMGINTKIVTSE